MWKRGFNKSFANVFTIIDKLFSLARFPEHWGGEPLRRLFIRTCLRHTHVVCLPWPLGRHAIQADWSIMIRYLLVMQQLVIEVNMLQQHQQSYLSLWQPNDTIFEWIFYVASFKSTVKISHLAENWFDDSFEWFLEDTFIIMNKFRWWELANNWDQRNGLLWRRYSSKIKKKVKVILQISW